MNSCTQKVVELRAGKGHPRKGMELLTWNAQLPWYSNDVFSRTFDCLTFFQLLNHKLPGIGSSSHCFLHDFLGALGLKLAVLQRTHRVSQFPTANGVELRIGKTSICKICSKVSCFAMTNCTSMCTWKHGLSASSESSHTFERLKWERPRLWTSKARAPILLSA